MWRIFSSFVFNKNKKTLKIKLTPDLKKLKKMVYHTVRNYFYFFFLLLVSVITTDKHFSINSLPASSDFCRLLLSFANSLDPDQARPNVGPDQDPNCSTP